MSKFNLNINGEKVDLNGISGGIKRKNIKGEKMLTIFDEIQKGTNKKFVKDDELSKEELKFILDKVKDRAMKWFNASNLGDKEYKSLVKKLKKEGIDLSQFSKAEFLEFIKTLSDVSKNPSASAVEQDVDQENQHVAGEEDQKEKFVLDDQYGKKEAVESEEESFEPAFRPDKPASIKKVSQPKVWQNSNPKDVVFNKEEDNTADKVLQKLMQANGIEAKEVQMNKLKEDLIRYNPSIFNKNGDVYVKPDWSRLDFPKNAKESYAIGAEIPEVEKNVTSKAADGTVPAPEAQKGAKKQGGAEKASKGGKSEPAKTFKAEDIQVTIQSTKQSEHAKLIDGYRKEGEKLHDSLKKGDTNSLTTQNIAYAFTQDIHFGPNSKAQAKKVFGLLYSRMAQLNLLQKDDCKSYERFSQMSLKEQDALLHDYRQRIVKKEREVVRTENARVANANARPARQKLLDEANEILVNTANNVKILKPGAFNVDENEREITLKLDNNKIMEFSYNEFGKVINVRIGSIDGEDNISYNEKGAWINEAGFELLKTSDYDFTKIQEVAQAIVDKKTKVKPAITPDKDGKYTPEQVQFKVEYSYYHKDQYESAMSDGEKIRTGKLGYDKLNPKNAAYSFGEKDDVVASGHAKEIFANLRARMITYNPDKKDIIYTNGEFVKMSPEEQNKIIHRYAKNIKDADQNRFIKYKENEKAKAGKNAKEFYNANKLLAEMASNPPEADKISYSRTSGINTLAKADMGDGKWIKAYYNEYGDIISVSVGRTVGDKDIHDVWYDTRTYTKTSEKDNKLGEIRHNKSYDFNKIKEFAKQIFGEWKEPKPVEEPKAE